MDTLHRLLRLRPHHEHSWTYEPKGIGGWGIAECSTCGRKDIW